jgi:hypothetical protein
MKVYIGKFINYVGPYQIADILKYVGVSNDKCRKIGEFLADKTPLDKICNYIYEKNKRKVKIKIHDYDTWNMNDTMAMIILPMLIQFKQNSQGAPFVDDEDVPEEIRSTNAPPKENDYDTDEFHSDRWNWVIDELIWTFEQLHPDTDWEEQYWITKPKIDLKKHPEDEGKQLTSIRWKVKGELDKEGYMKHNERINNGLRLFGKYYRGLWD